MDCADVIEKVMLLIRKVSATIRLDEDVVRHFRAERLGLADAGECGVAEGDRGG